MYDKRKDNLKARNQAFSHKKERRNSSFKIDDHNQTHERELAIVTQAKFSNTDDQLIQRKIKFYDNLLQGGHKTLTNDHTSDVAGIGAEIMKVASQIQGIAGLNVITGYHGDGQGHKATNFDENEKAKVNEIAKHFPNSVINMDSKGLMDSEIVNMIKNENVFFTWCFSDVRVKNIVDNYKEPSVNEKEVADKSKDTGLGKTIDSNK